ncbi:hypothetical protein JL193_07220 [Polaribacter batillariae]|uniref:Uncharacterized protein n=1 Tax=Polaribacter batillariae TaxID=2808900 RepID=A0ABX7SXQ4_9FLAO|nr:hypothetical protein [Polaribacter batillariae]QTD39032.1 hypothetical protein JL193_07220 [Polaribacter batillariae]
MINKIKDKDVVNCIEQCAVENKYWINKQEVAEKLKSSVDEIESIVLKSNNIILNGDGEITTRELYKKQTPFFNKLLDTFKNKIE